ncbi:hypothetical protein [Labilibacter marinus]|uniref:hypothetical protein n=1 Tax=Labilibacter marinus TaxID=1477105 RepID=UPI00094FDFFB|nr:hypothetical protein [Labilibacter marinus]
MSELSIKEQLLQEAFAIPRKEIKRLGMPYDTFLQESSELIQWAKQDAEQLQQVGFESSKLLQAEILLELAKEEHTRYANKSKYPKQSVSNWEADKKRGVELVKKLMHVFKFAFRHDKEKLGSISYIKQPYAKFEIRSHLDFLTLIGRKSIPLLSAVNFDIALLDEAKQLAEEITESHARMNSDTLVNFDKLKRDQLIYLLKNKLKELRACGKYVFKSKPNRLKGYQSNYVKVQNNKRRKKLD